MPAARRAGSFSYRSYLVRKPSRILGVPLLQAQVDRGGPGPSGSGIIGIGAVEDPVRRVCVYSPHLRGSPFHGLDDLVIARAAAEIAGQGLLDFRHGGL